MTCHPDDSSERTYELLSLLSGVKPNGENSWTALCPAHDDNQNSLSVSVGNSGKLLLFCHAKCSTHSILNAVNLNIVHLFPDRPKQGSKTRKGSTLGKSPTSAPSPEEQIVATYDYVDASGTLLYQSVRYEPKKFRQRRPKADGKPGWIWSVKETDKVPYQLPEILQSAPEVPIYIVEGEKDVNNLRTWGLVATCNVAGAGKWTSQQPHPNPTFIDPFRDHPVIILQDNDEAGKKHSEDVARKLHGIAASIKIILLPGLGDHGDVSDWIAAGGTLDQLQKIVTESPDWKFTEIKPVEAEDDPHRLARIVISQYLRVIYWREEFYAMGKELSATCYSKIPMQEFRATISKIIKTEFDRLNVADIESAPDKNHVCRKVTLALVSNTIGAIQSMTSISDDVELGSWLPDPLDGSGGFPRKESWISLSNGILKTDELLDGSPIEKFLIPHDPRWFSTVSLSFPFSFNADCPHWMRYLNSSLNGDEGRIGLLQEWSGYLLQPSTDQQKFLILEGEGSNGKSVYLAAMEALLGPFNTSHVPLEIFGQRFQLTSTLGKLVNICADCGEIDAVAEGYLKSFTSGDRMQFDRKGISAIDATPTARLMIATNNRPRFSDKSSGLWRRMLLVPFLTRIPESERIPGMDKPSWWIARPEELSGILNWALLGLERLRAAERFSVPEICQNAVDEYKLDTNPAQEFLRDRYEESNEFEQFVSAVDVYEEYQKFCEKNGYRPMGNRTFGKEVFRVFPTVTKARRGSRIERFWSYEGLKRQIDATVDEGSF